MGAYYHRSNKRRVTQIVVRGDNDPIEVSVPTIFGTTKKHTFDRSLFRGIPIDFDTRRFVDPKRPFLAFIENHGYFMLPREGLFDTSGVLDPILGMDVITFKRCPPSADYDPDAAQKLALKKKAFTEAKQKKPNQDV